MEKKFFLTSRLQKMKAEEIFPEMCSRVAFYINKGLLFNNKKVIPI